MIYLASLDEGIEDKLNKYYILHTREEVSNVIADNRNANTLLFRSNFISQFYTPSGFEELCINARRINPNLIIKTEETISPVNFDSMTQRFNNAPTYEDMLHIMSWYPKESFDTIKMLTGRIETEKNKYVSYSSQISELQNINNSLASRIKELESELELQRLTDESIRSKFDILLSRLNYQHGVNYNADKTFVCDENSFDKVLYFKEISKVQYVDSLIYYLKEILKIIYGMPTRLVVIESYYADGKLPLYPDLKPHYELTQEDVLSGDIVMLGMQSRTMNDILRNASNVSFLIVLDRAGYSQPHITGSNVEYIFTASDIKDVEHMEPQPDKSRIITYSADTLSIPYIEKFDELDSSGKMQLYSSFPITQSIIDLIQG